MLSAFSEDTPFAFVQRSVEEGAATKAVRFDSLSTSSVHTPADINSPYTYDPGAALFVRASLEADAPQVDILGDYFQSSSYDVKDLNVSKDGRYLIFSAHGPLTNVQHNSWNMYEYDFEQSTVRRIIADDNIANAGQDTNPTYALDGSVVFSSDRAAGTIDGREQGARR